MHKFLFSYNYSIDTLRQRWYIKPILNVYKQLRKKRLYTLSKPLRLYLQLHSCRSFPPRTFLQQWTPINIYVLFTEEHSPALYIRQNCNATRKTSQWHTKKKGHDIQVVPFLLSEPFSWFLSSCYEKFKKRFCVHTPTQNLFFNLSYSSTFLLLLLIFLAHL